MLPAITLTGTRVPLMHGVAMMDGRVDRDSITPVHVAPRYEPTMVLLKDLFHLVQQRAADGLVLHRGRGSQLLQQFALPLAELGRGLHFHLDMQVTAPSAIEHWHAFTTRLERCARLRTLGHLQRVLAVEGWHADLGAQRRLRKRNRHQAVQILAVALEEGMLFGVQHHVEIAGGATVKSRLAFAGIQNARAFLNARRHVDLHRALARDASITFALVALFHPADLHLLANTEDGFLEFEGEIFAQIGATLCARAPATASLPAEHVAESEEVAEDVLEIVEYRGVESAVTWAGAGGDSGVAEAVIASAFLRISEDRVGLTALLEALFRAGIVGVPVRVVLERELAIGALQLLIGCGAGDTQHLVVIAFYVGGQKCLPSFLDCAPRAPSPDAAAGPSTCSRAATRRARDCPRPYRYQPFEWPGGH